MMERLEIKRFGALHDRQFALGRTTIFVGPNESGKTTVFDALQEALCKPSRSRAEGKQIKQRYGDDLEASLVGAPEAPVDVDEFRSLFAVRASDLNVAIKDDAPWFSAVRARLFSGGVDPMAIIRALEPMTSDHGGRAINRELKQLAERRDQLTDELAKLRRRRDDLMARRARHEAMQAEQATVLTKLAALEAEWSQAEAAAVKAERAKERRLIEERLARYRRRESLDKELAELHAVSATTLAELQRLERHALDLIQQERLLLARLGDAQVGLSRLDEQRVALEAELDGERVDFDRHQALAHDLQRLTAEPPTHLVVAWQPLWLIAAGIALAAAAGVWWQFYPATAAVGGATALIVTAIVAAWQSARRAKVHDEDEWRRRLNAIAAAAGAEADGDATLLRRFLSAIVERQNARQHDLLRLGRERTSAAATCTKLQIESQRLTTARHEAEAALRQSLLASGVDALERYRDRVQQKERLTAQVAEVAIGGMTAAEAETLEERRRVLAADGIALLADADVVWTQASRVARELRDRLQSEQAKMRDAHLTLTREDGELQGQLHDLPESLVRLECAVAEAEEALDKKQIEKEAALMAREVLTEMAADAETRMAGLAADMAALWATINAQADVRVARLDGKVMEAADAGGTLRQADLLSSGTRDLFLLAARLALAARSGRNDTLLVFDDPFVMLDDERRQLALQMIAAAQARCGWQIVFFTKDDMTAAEAAGVLADPQTHRLERLSR